VPGLLVVVQEVVVNPLVYLLMVVVGMEHREFQITLVDHMLVEAPVVVVVLDHLHLTL
jgi:hypothetical protein